MAFVPMVSASPPPLSPDVTLDDLSGSDDIGGGGAFSGDDDEDLTGLSDKLHSIPIEAIRAAPPPTPSKKANVLDPAEQTNGLELKQIHFNDFGGYKSRRNRRYRIRSYKDSQDAKVI